MQENINSDCLKVEKEKLNDVFPFSFWYFICILIRNIHASSFRAFI